MTDHQLTLIAMIVMTIGTFLMAYRVGYITGREAGRWD
jgi:hypothetical protein